MRARWGWQPLTTRTSWNGAGGRDASSSLWMPTCHAYLALSFAPSPSVIRIRIEGLRDAELATLVQRVVSVVGEDLIRGVAVTVTPTSIRLRTLPLVQ